jgi:hypothetical protein
VVKWSVCSARNRRIVDLPSDAEWVHGWLVL